MSVRFELKRLTNKLGSVADANNVRVCPDVEPGQQAENQAREGVDRELQRDEREQQRAARKRTHMFMTKRIHLNLFQRRRGFLLLDQPGPLPNCTPS